MDVPIIGQTRPKTTEEIAIEDAKAAYDGLTDEQKEALASMAEQDAEAGEQVATAFLVVLSHTGEWSVDGDLGRKLVLSRPANHDDLLAGASVAISDVQVAKTAQQTTMAMMQMTQMAQQRMAQQQEAAAIQARLAQDGMKRR